METLRPLRTALCVYESLRLVFLVGAFIVQQPEGKTSFPWIALISPGALFLLMALFWRLNMPRYRPYGPLYLAGKGLSVITTMFWLFLAKSYMMYELLYTDTALLFVAGIMFFLLLGDALSAWLAIKIIKS